MGEERDAVMYGPLVLSGAEQRQEVVAELIEESWLVGAGCVEDKVGESGVDIGLDAGHGGVRVGRDDPPSGNLLDGQRVGGPFDVRHLVWCNGGGLSGSRIRSPSGFGFVGKSCKLV